MNAPSARKVRIAERIQPLGLVLLIIALAIPAAGATFRVSDVESQRDSEVQQKEVVTAGAVDLAERTLADCKRIDRTVDPETCQKAEEVKIIVQQLPPPPRRSDAEIRQLIEDTLRADPDLIPKAKDGTTPVVDYDRIVRMVQERIPPPAAGKDGETPVVDYDRIIRDVLALIPVPEDGKDGQNPPCMSTPLQCQGTDGENGQDGKPGRGVVSGPNYVSTENGCVSRTVYDQEPITVDVPASAVHCL